MARNRPTLRPLASHWRRTVEVLLAIVQRLLAPFLPLEKEQRGGLHAEIIQRKIAEKAENLRSAEHERVLLQVFSRLPPGFELSLKVREASGSLEGVVGVMGFGGGESECGLGEACDVFGEAAQEA